MSLERRQASDVDEATDDKRDGYLSLMPEEYDGPDRPDNLDEPPPFFPFDDAAPVREPGAMGELIEVSVDGVYQAENNGSISRFVLVTDGERKLPILIGAFEAQAIVSEHEAKRADRPMTHDLIKTIMLRTDVILDRVVIALASSDAQRAFHREHKDLAIADAAGLRSRSDRFDHAVDHGVGHHHLELHLGQEVDDILGAAIEFGMTLLPAEALCFGNGDAGNADFVQRFLHLVQLEGLDDRFDLFHSINPCRQTGFRP